MPKAPKTCEALCISIPSTDARAMRAIAKRNGGTISGQIQIAVRNFLRADARRMAHEGETEDETP